MTQTTTYNPDGSYSVYTTDDAGNSSTQNYSVTGVLQSDAWTKSDGSSGSDTFNADGSSSGNTFNADGSQSSYVNDGQGNTNTSFFNASGVKTNDLWSQANGSSGSDIFNADGTVSSGTLNLGDANQTVVLGDANYVVTAGNGNDVITLGAGNDVVNAGNGNDTISGNGALSATVGSGNDLLQGGSGASKLNAGSGNDTLVAGSGLATLVGGSGTDTFVVNNTNDVVQAKTGASNTIQSSVSISYSQSTNVQTLQGTGSAALTLMDATVGATIIANSGNDTLMPGNALATLVGGSGVDTFDVYNAGDVIIAAPGNNDIEFAGAAIITLAPNLHILNGSVGPGGTLIGNNLADVITGGTGATTLVAGSGPATLVGGSGNDTFVINSANDVIQAAPYGNNTELTPISVNAATSIGKLVGTGGAAITLTGGYIVQANSGNDTLIAGTQGTTLIGGSGNDTFVVNSAWTVVQAQAGSNINTLLTSVSPLSGNTYVAPANVQNVTGTGTTGLFLFANNSSTAVITSNGAADVMGAGTGNDTLVSGTGNDTMYGSTGNDTFVVNSAKTVVSALAAGVNTIQASVSYTASSNVPTLTGIGNAAITLTGNSMADLITANSGNDTLIPGTGQATLVGGSGSDTLIGGFSPTTMVGGSGNDTFVVNMPFDVINEAPNNGNNTEQTGISTTLAANVQNLVGTGTYGLILTANNLNAVIVSNSAVDTLVGGSGNDTFVVNNVQDVINPMGNAAGDKVQTSLSYVLPAGLLNLTGTGSNTQLTGNSGDDVITDGGTGYPNRLIAGSGNDTLVGNLGGDSLVGGSGNDTFIVTSTANKVSDSFSTTNNTILTPVSYTAPVNVQNLTGTGSAQISLTDTNLKLVNGQSVPTNVLITSNSAPDHLTGALGNNNTFVVNNVSDLIQVVNTGALFPAAMGVNTIDTSVSFFTPGYVQNLTGIGNGNIALSAGSYDEVLTSNSGVDTLYGGAGNDTFVLNNAADVIYPTSNTNSVVTSFNYFMPYNVQNLTATGSANVTLGANNSNDVIVSNSGIDTLYGGSGNDTFVINNSADVLNLLYSSSAVTTVDTSVSYTTSGNVQNLTGTGSANITLSALGVPNDTITSNTGIDTLAGGSGNTTFVVNNSADVLWTQNNSSNAFNIVNSSVNYVLPSNMQDLILTGSAALTGSAQNGNALLIGNSGADTLTGGNGIDVLEAGAGNSVLIDNGPGALIAGAGADTLAGGSAPTFVAAGAGNDAVYLGTGATVLAYNTGDGNATIFGSTSNDVLSLGKGIAYANLAFSKSGNNLILNTGSGAITFTNWYGGSSQDFTTLQVVEQSASTYSASSPNPLYNQGVEEFNFTQLVSQFNAALAAQPTLTSWSLSNSLLSAHLSGSNNTAFGGDLAYYEGLNGNLTGLNMATAVSTLQNYAFGKAPQTIDNFASVSNGNNKLH